ncbi:MAG TPA: NAD-dependent malic enzyme, partial [Streptosporangiaceae bacterium]|nr:NAD-dependent malic enzyme [Streptosporangiaceae bacterium]
MRSLWLDDAGSWQTTLRGRQVLADPRINKGTAFSDAERADLGLIGLIPAGHMNLEQQVSRVYAQYQRQSSDLGRNVLLNEVHDRNEVLYYRLLAEHLSEMLPVVYTPTVGQAIENYSHEYRRPRGVYLSVDQPELIKESLQAFGLGGDDVDLIVATDAGSILGIGDWGVGGMGIAV